ncbi:MAG TPA: hypothetical protein VEJ40_00315 [Pseudolabrys sp.]|jgi:hypothetical protein|nr:hypothetical protein [Pseudolabrys sp.]
MLRHVEPVRLVEQIAGQRRRAGIADADTSCISASTPKRTLVPGRTSAVSNSFDAMSIRASTARLDSAELNRVRSPDASMVMVGAIAHTWWAQARAQDYVK